MYCSVGQDLEGRSLYFMAWKSEGLYPHSKSGIHISMPAKFLLFVVSILLFDVYFLSVIL